MYKNKTLLKNNKLDFLSSLKVKHFRFEPLSTLFAYNFIYDTKLYSTKFLSQGAVPSVIIYMLLSVLVKEWQSKLTRITVLGNVENHSHNVTIKM